MAVVDGPGDGRSDVSSTTPDGTAHLAQCRFHRDVTAAVGARETDELPVALLKFGCKSGLFVTTARLCPQSTREYLNDFPGFELQFWDGLQLVDQVLSSPLLTELWFELPLVIRSKINCGASPNSTPLSDDRDVARPNRPASQYLLQLSATLVRIAAYNELIRSVEGGGRPLGLRTDVMVNAREGRDPS